MAIPLIPRVGLEPTSCPYETALPDLSYRGTLPVFSVILGLYFNKEVYLICLSGYLFTPTRPRGLEPLTTVLETVVLPVKTKDACPTSMRRIYLFKMGGLVR